MALATYTFASVLRRGFQPDASGQTGVTVRVGGLPPDTRAVPLLTAGDVTGLPPAQIIRTWPADGVAGVEPNYLALVEFDAPELPWLFSRPADGGGRVHPWLCLAVVDVTDGPDPLSASEFGHKITTHADQLPDPAEAWLWAHAQLLGTDTVPEDPSRSLSRLIAPRRLVSGRRYLACVLPTLKSTALAALGSDPGDQRTSAAFAWTPASGQVTLPVFHHWRFTTGPSGDFEALVRRLHGVPLPPGMGRRRVLLDHPRSGLPAPLAAGAELEMHAALRPPGERLDPLVPLVGPTYVDALRARLADAGYDVSLLTHTPDAPPPVVGPPVYGQLPVGPTATASGLGSAVVPPWLSELNLDPRLRIAAGLGAQVARTDQDSFLEDAWRQVGDVLAANRLRRRAEFALAGSRRLHTRWIARLDPGDLLTQTAPVHAKIFTADHQTLVGRLRTSPLPPAVVSVEFRRVTRARAGASEDWRKAAGVAALAARSAERTPLLQFCALDSIDRIAAPSEVWGVEAMPAILATLAPSVGVLEATEAAARLDALAVPTGLTVPSPARVDAALSALSALSADALATRAGLLPLTAVRAVVDAPVVPAPPAPQAPPLRPGRRRRSTVAVALARAPIDVLRTNPALARVDGLTVRLDARALTDADRVGPVATTIDEPLLQRLVARRPAVVAETTASFGFTGPAAERVSAQLIRVTRRQVELAVQGGGRAVTAGTALEAGFAGLRDLVVASLDPRTTILRAVNSRIAALAGGEDTTFDQIMAAPELSRPTYQSLAAISHDWLLPGVDALPADTTTLAASNSEFIAAFLVGLNHELSRELLWHEYPTDQRGTYSRQFWTHKITGDRASRYDLKHELHKASRLSLGRLVGDGTDPLVLIIKGDLVRRYPSMIVTAAHTEAAGDGSRKLAVGGVLEPDFSGLLAPDVLLLGFALTEADVRDAAGDPARAWWFFFAEHFAEPRFGFDELVENGVELGPDEHRTWAGAASWNDAAWQHAALDAHGRLTASSFSQNLPKGGPGAPATRYAWGADAATQAWVTLQFPFRRGVEAIRLVPPEVA